MKIPVLFLNLSTDTHIIMANVEVINKPLHMDFLSGWTTPKTPLGLKKAQTSCS